MKAYMRMFQNYFDFRGYTARGDFWKAFLMHTVIYSILGLVSMALGQPQDQFNFILGVYSLVSSIPFFAMIVRRLRDARKSIANLFWCLLPLIGQIVLVVKLAQPQATFYKNSRV